MGKKRWGWLVVLGIIGCSGGAEGPVQVGISSASSGVTGNTTGFEGFSLAEVVDVPFSNSETTLDLSSSASSQYLLVVTSANPQQGSYSVKLGNPSESSAPVALTALSSGAGPEPAESEFHEYLREAESILVDSGEKALPASSGLAALTEAPAVGKKQSFRVLSNIGSISQYQDVTATLRAATAELYIYVDQNAAAKVSDEDVTMLIEKFERIGLPRDRKLFGPELDTNADGHITILMSCIPNRMTVGSGGIVTGFFSPTDRFARSSSNPASNEQEILYTMVPDPDGSCGGIPVSDSFTKNILPGVLAHEFQHLINFDHHVSVYHGATEEPWLNECLSHLAEDLTGFGNENPSRVRLFLAQPNNTALVPATSPTLTERGACYSFLRYLYEQSNDPSGFVWRLTNTSKVGIQNVEAAFQGKESSFDEFPEMMARWAVTLALSETGATTDARFNYQPRVRNPETGQYQGLCIRCNAEDGRGTVLGGPVVASVSTLPATLSSPAIQFLSVRASGNVTLSGTKAMKIAKIRLQRP